MTRARRTLQKLDRLATRPAELSPSLEQAFVEIERPAPKYADATPDRTEGRSHRSTLTHDARSNA